MSASTSSTFTLWWSSAPTLCSHHQWRRRLANSRLSNPPCFLSISSSLPGRRRSRSSTKRPSDQRVEMVIDVEDMADRASMSVRRFLAESEARFDGFVASGKEAFSDLKTLVVVDRDRRVIISYRRSSLRFLGNCLLWGVLIVVIARFVVRLGVWGFGGGYRGFWIRRRDRSLAGKEVVVGRRNDFNFKVPVNPLSPARGMVTSRDEEMALPSRKRVSTEKKLPKWWPDSVSYSSAPNAGKELQKEAQRVIRAEVFSSGSHSIDLQIEGEDPRQFIAGLADNIGLESTHASRIVSAAVAARTRSYFLQAWALEMQQKRDEAVMELSKICLIHKIFPPEESSPEMEMVARGLERHLRIEQREQLLSLLLGTCDAASSRSAAEALGLVRNAGLLFDQGRH